MLVGHVGVQQGWVEVLTILAAGGTYGIYALHTETLRRGLVAQAEHDAVRSLSSSLGSRIADSNCAGRGAQA